MSKRYVEVVVSRSKSVMDYTLEVITLLNQGMDEVKIKGVGREISKAVDVYNSVKDRLGDGVDLVNTEIGTEKGKKTSYIIITVARKY
mgnify:FL=1